MAVYLKELGYASGNRQRIQHGHVAVFQEQAIRRTWHENEWWFAVVDVVGGLSGSISPEGYIRIYAGATRA